MSLQYLADLWDESHAKTLDPAALLRYRSNLLGSDLRITNIGGGNTSSKLEGTDPLDGQKKTVLWVKGSGGDLGSIKVEGFATLYLDKVLALARIYRGVELEDGGGHVARRREGVDVDLEIAVGVNQGDFANDRRGLRNRDGRG